MITSMNLNSSVLRIVLLLMFVCTVKAVVSEKVFNVKDYGATPDGKTDSSKALLGAWKEACVWNGTGRVLIPEGTFLIGPVILKGPCKSNIIFQVKGVVVAPGLEKFESDGWIDFDHINGLMVTGGGTFDGRGALAWPHNQCSKTEKCKRLPRSLMFSFVTDATIQSISSLNSKLVHIHIFASKNIKIQSVKISAPGDSPNTDGIHITDSSGIEISRSIIGTGDDCISIGSGNSDISISNILCGPGHGISIGSLGNFASDKDVAGVSVQNCKLTGTSNGVRIKTWPDSFGISASNFTFQDIIMHNVSNPIVIDQDYCPYNFCSRKHPSRVRISDIHFVNISGSSASQIAVNFLCSKNVPCQNVELNNINIVYNGLEGPAKSLCSNVKGTSYGQQNPPSCLQSS